MLLLFVLMFLFLGFWDIEFDCCEHWNRHAKSSQNQSRCCCLRQRDDGSGLIFMSSKANCWDRILAASSRPEQS
jgi:hypothetical protein